MKHLSQIIFEGLEYLYHFTHIRNMINVLEKDRWMCSINDGVCDFKCPDYYISFTRSQNTVSGYPTGLDETDLVKVVFNERKLHSRYKIRPITFHKGSKKIAIKDEWEKRGKVDMFNSYKDEYMKQTNTEAEERLMTDDKYIQNISKYIHKLIINADKVSDDNLLRQLQELCLKRKIECQIVPEKVFNNAH